MLAIWDSSPAAHPAVITDSLGRFALHVPAGIAVTLVATAPGFRAIRHPMRALAAFDTLAITLELARTSATVLRTIRVLAESQSRLRRQPGAPDIGGVERQMLGATAQPTPGDNPGNLAALAAAAAGIFRVPGEAGAGGFSTLGMDPSRNVIALDGLTFSPSSVPRNLVLAAAVTTSGYDVGRGGYSGGRMDLSVIPGSNLTVREGWVAGSAPWLQAGGAPRGPADGTFTAIAAGGAISGPLTLNRSYYRVAAEWSRRSLPLNSFLSVSAGDAPRFAEPQLDSVRRWPGRYWPLDLEQSSGRVRTEGSALLQLDVSPREVKSLRLTAAASWNGDSHLLQSNRSEPRGGADLHVFRTNLQVRASGLLFGGVNETSVGASGRIARSHPLTVAPAVHVFGRSSDAGSVELLLGAPDNVVRPETQWGAHGRSENTWRINRHEVRATVEASQDQLRGSSAFNPLGSFSYPSFADLWNNTPSSFSRRVSSSARVSRTGISAALGDQWHRDRRFSAQVGIRADLEGFGKQGTGSTSGVGDEAMTAWIRGQATVSPRAGLEWNYGTRPDGGARGTVRGGVGRFVGSIPLQTPLSVLLGRTSGGSVVCTGANAPSLGDEPAVGSAGCRSTPDLQVPFSDQFGFSPDFRPTESWRWSLGWTGTDWGSYIPELNVTLAEDVALPGATDLNLERNAAFTLPREGGRPVFGTIEAVDTRTGAVSPQTSRREATTGQIRVLTASRRGRSSQLTASLIRSKLGGAFARLAYTFQKRRELTNGYVGSTAGDPYAAEWTPVAHGATHSVKGSLILPIRRGGLLTAFIQWQSGTRYTPLVRGDINGDGLANDRAFVPSPSADGSGLAESLRSMLATRDRSTRHCIESQWGRIAAPGSCAAPAWLDISSRFELPHGAFGLPERARLRLEVFNLAAGIDRLLHGSTPRGWGQDLGTDPHLLIPIGFDSARRSFAYAVNSTFGSGARQWQSWRPFQLRLEVKVDLTADRVKQQIAISRRTGARSFDQALAELLQRYPDPFEAVLMVRDSVSLSAAQIQQLRQGQRRFAEYMRRLWSPAAASLAAAKQDDSRLTSQLRAARNLASIEFKRAAAEVRSNLSDSQLRRLPGHAQFILEPKYLELTGLDR